MSHRKNQVLLERIATVLKGLRELKGVSQQDVYNDTNIHLGRIESSKANINITTLSDLCKYFEIKLSKFLEMVESSENN
jgi:transcriptional regulator with XRE-family HTH domain